MSGRKRHLLVDTQGFLLKVVVSAADVQDRDGGRLVAHALRLFGPCLPRLALIWADAAYAGAFVEEMGEQFGWRVQIVKRFEERSFGWMGGFRRLAKDYEYELESSEAMIYAAMSHLLLRRIVGRAQAPSKAAG